MKERIILNLFLAASILYLPWWATVVFAVMLLLRHKAYEVIVWAFVLDSIYAGGAVHFFGFEFIATTLSFLFFVVITRFKRNLIFY